MMMLWILIMVGIVGLDRLSKWLAVTYLKDIGSFPIIKDAIHLTYSENTGAAFGILRDRQWVFLVFSALAIAAIVLYLVLAKPKNKLCIVALAFILGGGIGNMIDRIAYGFVVDFIDFTLIDFAIFNTADSFITVGAVLLVLYVLLFDSGLKKNHEADRH